ncbi:MAG: YlmH/Sll1252 family protein [Lachnospiraceae bacterium]|jgi:RNA-binding protein YlmH|nr:YlmH/Sll1252 family protein [Lachnospiraceae bacterium]MDD4526116.1 YlmH/Sll1252 family protein [Lachnospiraceae bacterium]NLC73689.1 hypothetical protein [Clostridiales bacterium]
MTQDDIRFRKRIEELQQNAYRNSLFLFTDFLNETELEEAAEILGDSGISSSGGWDGAERRMLRFGSEEDMGYTVPFPITIIRISPLLDKFSDEFTHRDFLGAVLNLGIERSVIGDILIREHTAWLFAKDTIASFIVQNLDQVKHTHVRCEVVTEVPDALQPKLVREDFQISSERLDAVVSHVYNLSRSQSLDLFRTGKVTVNGRVTENNSAAPKSGDAIAVRGYGKMIYTGTGGVTRKGKLNASVEKYV